MRPSVVEIATVPSVSFYAILSMNCFLERMGVILPYLQIKLGSFKLLCSE